MIVIDPLFYWPAFGHTHWSHMSSDTSVEELHEFAKKIGLKRSWFQDRRIPHYDITKGKRFQAIKNGAKELPRNEWLEAVAIISENRFR